MARPSAEPRPIRFFVSVLFAFVLAALFVGGGFALLLAIRAEPLPTAAPIAVERPAEVPAPSEIGAIRPVLRTEDAGVERSERALVRPERTVRLRVATTGAPLPATAGVAVVDATSSVPLAWSPVAADGTVVIDRLPIGEHTVVLAPSRRHVRTEWFARGSLPRDADAGNESDARIETTLQSVAVTLTLGSDGAPSPSTLASAVIVLTRADAPGWRRSLSMAGLDNDGRTVRVDLGVLAAGRYEVALHCADVLGAPREPNAITVPGPAEHTFTIASR